ncbi:MAG TPA: hypothetical protein VKY26_12690, partial [Actinomycetota bacterium]|nr:hypothetical protein [Actinomycetota bacterium]
MPHSLRRKLTPAGIAANLSLVAILGSFVAIAPIAGLTGTAQAATGTITEYRPQGTPCDLTGTPGGCIVQTSASDPNGIVSDNGQIFYTDAGETVATAGLTAPDNQMGAMNVDGSGFTTYHEVPQGAVTVAIAADNSSNLWAVDYGNASDDVFGANPAGGSIADIQLDPVSSTATQGFAPALPTSITKGPDGRMWWTESGSGRIDAISTTGLSGSVQCWVTSADPCSEYTLPGGQAVGNTTTAVTASPEDITAGPDGNLYATVDGTRMIAKITTSGSITEFPTPGSNG